jgi:N-acetylmuramate 1-kinase
MSHPLAISWADPQRQSRFEAWLIQNQPAHSLQIDSIELASSDASFRRYFRIKGGDGASRIIMDAPPDKEDCRPFAQVATLVRQAGLSGPEVLSWDEALGFMLLTDIGQDTLMQRLFSEGVQPDVLQAQTLDDRHLPWFREAIDWLVRWQLSSRPGVLAPYDDALLSREMALFPQWYLARHKGVDCDSPEHAGTKQVLDEAFALIKRRNLSAPMVFVHRDFMPRNMMVSPAGLGVLDFQDAVCGPITYDIASLMRDAFVTWDEEFVMDVTIRYWERAKKAGLIANGAWGEWADDFGSFYAAVEWMGLQRHLKVAGIFARLSLRDGKPQYLADTPRFMAYIRHTCSRYNVLKPLLRLIDDLEGTAQFEGYQFGR